MDKKGIQVAIDLDTAEVTKKLSELQNKLKGMMGAQATLGDSPRDMQMKQAFQRSEGIYRDQMKKKYEEQDKIIDELLKKERELGKELDRKVESQKELNKEAQEYLQITSQIIQARNKQQTAANNICPLGTKWNPQTKTCDPDPTGGGGGGDNPPTPPNKFDAFLQSAQGTAGGFMAVARSFLDMGDFFNRRRPTYSAERNISLAESMYAPTKRAMKGENFEDLMFADERAAARKDSFNMMANQMGINKGLSAIQGIAGIGMIAAGILTGGAALPLAALAGGATLFGGKGEGFEGLKGLTGDWTEINKKTGQQTADFYKTQIENQKAQNPIRTAFKEFISENRNDIIKGMRTTGMSERDFMNNYVLGKGTFGEEEFVFKQRAAMTQQMMQAGGSMGASYGQNMVTALQAQRGLGLTNAGQVMGRLSSYLSPQESEQSFIRILGKGVSIGTAELRDVQQDYFEQVSAIAQQVGTNEDLVASLMAASLQGNMTRRGVEFAAEGTKTAMGMLSESTGLAGAIKARGIAQSDTFKKLSALDRKMLQQMDIADIEVGNQKFEYFYKKSGTNKSKEEFANELKNIFQDSVTGGYGDISSKIKDINKALETGKETNKDSGEEIVLTPERRKELQTERNLITAFIKNIQGTYEKQRSVAEGLFGYRGMEGAGDDFSKKYEEFEEMRKSGVPLDPEYVKKMRKSGVGFKTRPESSIEQLLAMMGISQQQVLSSETTGPMGEGKTITDIMDEMAKNMGQTFDKSVAERVQLTKFHEALVNGANEAIEAFINTFTDYKVNITTATHPKYGTPMSSKGKQGQTKKNIKP